MQTLTCAQTVAKYKTLENYYAQTTLTTHQTLTLINFLQYVLTSNACNAQQHDLQSLQNNLQSVANVTQLNSQQYDVLLLKYNTNFREKLNSLLRIAHSNLYNTLHSNLNVCLLDLY